MTRNKQSDIPKAHPCTFRRCKHSYVTLRNLKQHLRDVRGGGYDNVHPKTDPEWKRLDDSNFLKVHRRPGDLPQEERDRRRALAQKQHYERHKVPSCSDPKKGVKESMTPLKSQTNSANS